MAPSQYTLFIFHRKFGAFITKQSTSIVWHLAFLQIFYKVRLKSWRIHDDLSSLEPAATQFILKHLQEFTKRLQYFLHEIHEYFTHWNW